MPDKRSQALPVQCKATAASGERCKAKPHKNGLCFFHSDPARAAECEEPLGRGDGSNSRWKMDPRLGTTLGYLGTSLLKAIETSDIEDRLGKLENGFKE